MKVAKLAVAFLALACMMGCSESDALKKAKADAEAARAELAKAKADEEAAKAELALLRKTLLAEPKVEPDHNQIMAVGKRFVILLRDNSPLVVYDDLTSIAYQKQHTIKTLSELTNQHPAIKRLEPHEASKHELKKAADGKAYIHVYRARPFAEEKWNAVQASIANTAADSPFIGGDRTARLREIRGDGPRIEFTFTLIQESGAWKVDKLDIMEEKP